MKKALQFFFNHRTLAMLRWDLYMIRLRFNNWCRQTNSKVRSFVKAMPRPALLNLGSGPRGSEDANWINIDAFYDRNVDFLLDFTRPLPFESASLDGVFCEHVLEHFTYAEGLSLSSEICRTLVPGGVFRIIVPDGPWIMRSYFDGPAELVKHRGDLQDSPMQVVNAYFRQRYEHHFLYDFSTMEKMLREAGFSEVQHLSYRQGAYNPQLLLDDPKYAVESLYVEAKK